MAVTIDGAAVKAAPLAGLTVHYWIVDARDGVHNEGSLYDLRSPHCLTLNPQAGDVIYAAGRAECWLLESGQLEIRCETRRNRHGTYPDVVVSSHLGRRVQLGEDQADAAFGDELVVPRLIAERLSWGDRRDQDYGGAWDETHQEFVYPAGRPSRPHLYLYVGGTQARDWQYAPCAAQQLTDDEIDAEIAAAEHKGRPERVCPRLVTATGWEEQITALLAETEAQ